MKTVNRRTLLGMSLGAAALYAIGDRKSMAAIEAPEGATAAAGAASANVRSLGTPCQARNINSGLVIEDRGREYMALGNMNEKSGMELILIDIAAGTGDVYRAPAGAGSWALQLLPGNRLAVGTFYDGMFMVFDIGKREWVFHGRLSNEEYIWTFALGNDGRVYGGTYPGARLGALDPETYKIEDLGKPSEGNLYLRYTSALPDGRIFCQAGFNKPETFVFDPRTKQFTHAPAALQSAAQGFVWNGYFIVGQTAYSMPDLSAVEPPPFPIPDAKDGAWAPDIRLSTKETLVLRQGLKIWKYRANEKALTLWMETPGKGMGTVFGSTKDGDLVGVRGQDFFVLKPGDKEVVLNRIPGVAAPRDTHFLYADHEGRLWGGPTFGQTLFYMDAGTGKATNTSAISESGGEVYDVEVVDGVAFAVAYAGGEVIRFDPKAPWDQVGHVNPKTVAKVGPGYIRPSAGIMRGPDGKLYSGWLAKYGAYGGALAITDPHTFKTEIIQDPLGPHGLQGVEAIEGGRVLLGTSTYGNGLGEEKGVSAAFGVYDLAAGKATFTHTFPGAASVSNLTYDPHTKLAAMIVNGQLWLFDTVKNVFPGDGPAIPDKVGGSLTMKGKELLYSVDTSLMARDLSSGKTTNLATLPEKVDRIAVAPDGKVYVSCGAAIYEVKV